MKQRILLATLAVALVSAAAAPAMARPFMTNTAMMSPRDPGSIRMLPERDRKFLQMAAQGNMAEVDLGRLAQEKGASAEVKAFGEHMEMDHEMVRAHLTRLAQKLGVRLPFFVEDAQHQTYEKLEGLSGADFDREFAQVMVDDHAKTLQAFRDEAAYGFDPDVRDFAARQLPTLQMHSEEALALHKSMRRANGMNDRAMGDKPMHRDHKH
jgi:putative membrane protein